jgi:hypothetical protein
MVWVSIEQKVRSNCIHSDTKSDDLCNPMGTWLIASALQLDYEWGIATRLRISDHFLKTLMNYWIPQRSSEIPHCSLEGN